MHRRTRVWNRWNSCGQSIAAALSEQFWQGKSHWDVGVLHWQVAVLHRPVDRAARTVHRSGSVARQLAAMKSAMTRLARAAAWLLCVAAAQPCRMAGALDRFEPGEDERGCARALVATCGKLDRGCGTCMRHHLDSDDWFHPACHRRRCRAAGASFRRLSPALWPGQGHRPRVRVPCRAPGRLRVPCPPCDWPGRPACAATRLRAALPGVFLGPLSAHVGAA